MIIILLIIMVIVSKLWQVGGFKKSKLKFCTNDRGQKNFPPGWQKSLLCILGEFLGNWTVSMLNNCFCILHHQPPWFLMYPKSVAWYPLPKLVVSWSVWYFSLLNGCFFSFTSLPVQQFGFVNNRPPSQLSSSRTEASWPYKPVTTGKKWLKFSSKP